MQENKWMNENKSHEERNLTEMDDYNDCSRGLLKHSVSGIDYNIARNKSKHMCNVHTNYYSNVV